MCSQHTQSLLFLGSSLWKSKEPAARHSHYLVQLQRHHTRQSPCAQCTGFAAGHYSSDQESVLFPGNVMTRMKLCKGKRHSRRTQPLLQEKGQGNPINAHLAIPSRQDCTSLSKSRNEKLPCRILTTEVRFPKLGQNWRIIPRNNHQVPGPWFWFWPQFPMWL